jgi:hypothetical protein
MDDGPGPVALVGEDEDAVRAFLSVRLTSGEAWRLEDMFCCWSVSSSVSLGSSETMTGCLDTTILGLGGPCDLRVVAFTRAMHCGSRIKPTQKKQRMKFWGFYFRVKNTYFGTYQKCA